jgi:hypothetical protein
MPKLIKWSQGNIKLPDRIIHMSLPSGYTCPSALACLTKANANTGKITDGKDQEYRCYASMQEARHSGLRNLRWHNFKILKPLSSKDMFKTLKVSLQKLHDDYIINHDQRPIVRAHIGGDFFNEDYFLAWIKLAESFKPTWFYSYTKRLDLWVKHIKNIPLNFELNASKGGKQDHLISDFNLKCAQVVYSIEEAELKGLKIDHDDGLAYRRGTDFAQLIHGCQPKGSKASKALIALKKESGWTGYNKDTKKMS